MATRTDARSRRSFQLLLHDQMFIACWWMVVLLHAADFAFLVAWTRLNYWLVHTEFARFNLLDLLSFDISYDTLNLMNWVFAIIAGLHGLALLRVFRGCFNARRLDFYDSERTRAFISGERLQVSTRFESLREDWLVGAFYIRGKHFDDFFLVQEYLEVAAQIYQAKRMSDYVATRWINNLFVGMIFINAMSTPLIHLLVPAAKIPLRRMLAVTMSAFLNFVNSVVIPLVIFDKYIHAYDPVKYNFSDELLFDDVWFPKAIHENEQLFVTSWLDFVSTLWPHISLLDCLVTCQRVLGRRSTPKPNRVVPFANPQEILALKPVISNPLRRIRTKWQAQELDGRPTGLSRVARIRRIFYNLLWLAGVVVLGIHINAQHFPDTTGCMLSSTPWFSGGKSSCVLLKVNCYRRGIVGSQVDIESILTPLNTESMNIVIFEHCPRLGIPPVLRQFRLLFGVEIYNSTIEDWPAESAPRVGDFVLLQYIDIINSNLTSLPAGLVQDSFPVQDMYFYGANLTTLPRSIKDSWVAVRTLLLEHSKFTEIPAVVNEMSLEQIALTANPLVRIDTDVFANKDLMVLYLSGCPLTSLPAGSSSSLSALARLPLEYTLLEQVPMFVQRWYLANSEWVLHSLFGSPYCTKTVVDPLEQKYQEQVCAKDLGTIVGRYPLDVVLPQRQI